MISNSHDIRLLLLQFCLQKAPAYIHRNTCKDYTGSDWSDFMTTNEKNAETQDKFIDNGHAHRTATVSYFSLTVIFMMELEPVLAAMSIPELRHLVMIGKAATNIDRQRERVAWLHKSSPLFRRICAMQPGSCDDILSLLLDASAREAKETLDAKLGLGFF